MLTLLENRVETLFRGDGRGRLVEINQCSGGLAPRFFLMRTAEGAITRFRHDLPDDLVRSLETIRRAELAADPPSLRPAYEREYLEALAPVERVWAGPAFVFAHDPSASAGVVAIDEANVGLLAEGFPDWLADVPHRQPFVARIEAGRAVAICASVRISRAVHCAGVETLPACRGRGHASAVVSAWARAVRSLGATPFYSTSWDNLASQGVARRLGLALAGVDFHLT
ncbi:MAG TPA: GNAT family N-acetyltransferase [Caulobacteraceae bacterium]|jgi:GNAT superfamily N-acetyltransferase